MHEHLLHYVDTLLSLISNIRSAVDGLETPIDVALWPLPTYQELLFLP